MFLKIFREQEGNRSFVSCIVMACIAFAEHHCIAFAERHCIAFLLDEKREIQHFLTHTFNVTFFKQYFFF